MASKNSKTKVEKIISYEEYLKSYCPNILEDEILLSRDPKFIGSSLAKQTMGKIIHQLR